MAARSRAISANTSRAILAIVNQNMPGAAGITATNWAYSIAPKDGTVILATYNALLAEPLYGNPAARYDVLKFEYVGSIGKQQNVCGTWHTSPIKTIDQAKAREVTVAATGATGNSASMPRILNGMLGTKFKLIMGYGTTEQRLAVERGEVGRHLRPVMVDAEGLESRLDQEPPAQCPGADRVECAVRPPECAAACRSCLVT